MSGTQNNEDDDDNNNNNNKNNINLQQCVNNLRNLYFYICKYIYNELCIH